VNAVLISDTYGIRLIEAGVNAWGLSPPDCTIVEMPLPTEVAENASTAATTDSAGLAQTDAWVDSLLDRELAQGMTHIVAIERVGPSHTWQSVAEREGDAAATRFAEETPPEHRNAHHNMRGLVIDRHTAPMYRIFQRIAERKLPIATIGVGDGGNEIGMGKFPWSVLREAIRVGPAAHTACRVATDHAIVAGVSNWGAYALALGVAVLRGKTESAAHWTIAEQAKLIERMVAAGAVDGVTKQRTASVDGLSLDEYLAVLKELRRSALECGSADNSSG
jgi:hypothetical protein